MRSPAVVLAALAVVIAAVALTVALGRDSYDAHDEFFEVELTRGSAQAVEKGGFSMHARCTSDGVATLFRTTAPAALSRDVSVEVAGRDVMDAEGDRDFGPGETGLDTRAYEGPYNGMAVYYREDPDEYALVHWHAWREDDGRCVLAGVVG